MCDIYISEFCQNQVTQSLWIGCEPYNSQYLQIASFMLIFFLHRRFTYIHSNVPVLTDSVWRKNKSTCRWVEWPIWYVCWKIECGVVFTLTNIEKQICYYFSQQHFLTYLAGWVMSVCWEHSLVKGEMEKVKKNKARVSGRDRLYFRRLFFFFKSTPVEQETLSWIKWQ